MMNKIKNSKSNDKFRIIFDYFKIIEFFSGSHLKLNSKIYNYFLNFKYNCFFLTNLKYAYFIILLHFENRYYFVFIIFEINQI